MEYEQLGCLHDMFRRQAKLSPAAVAVVADDGRTMTYAELDEVTDKHRRLREECSGQEQALIEMGDKLSQ